MAALNIHRVTALPGTLEANSIYLVAPAAKPDYVEMYVTGNSASAVKRIINEDDILALIADAASAASAIDIVADIAARNALSPLTVTYVFVQDATGDATVASGGATYLYNPTASAWVKVSEAESLDIAVTWSALSGKPSSTVADIDDAVTKKHSHANKTQLDKIGQDANGNLTYDGALPHIGLDTAAW